jgi:hypothetical protein
MRARPIPAPEVSYHPLLGHVNAGPLGARSIHMTRAAAQPARDCRVSYRVWSALALLRADQQTVRLRNIQPILSVGLVSSRNSRLSSNCRAHRQWSACRLRQTGVQTTQTNCLAVGTTSARQCGFSATAYADHADARRARCDRPQTIVSARQRLLQAHVVI